ncbi:hypothetical protein [Rhizobium leguminosarum]|uniref:hypothetical protein n=1 Tax=Rhizobium leguminosarum TaxID=384 RepID=UPI0021BBF078|nr:hypothetical protein [Rhizobium leguminosarum]
MASDDDRLRIMHGGPFYELMTRLGMRKRGWRAFVFAGLCWTIPVLLLLATRGGHGAGLFLHDWGASAKFLIAPVLLTLAEKPIGFALDECVSTLFRIPLVASQSMPDTRKALRDARSRTTSWKPEFVCIAVALAATAFNAAMFVGGAAAPGRPPASVPAPRRQLRRRRPDSGRRRDTSAIKARLSGTARCPSRMTSLRPS